jgi:four helix bundle protein
VFKFGKLEVWQEAMSLVGEVYSLTQAFPKEEQYGLVSQLRRSAVSIPSNIAEGTGRSSDKDFLHFVFMARGSLVELVTQIKIAGNLKLLTNKEMNRLVSYCERLHAKISNLIKYLSQDNV